MAWNEYSMNYLTATNLLKSRRRHRESRKSWSPDVLSINYKNASNACFLDDVLVGESVFWWHRHLLFIGLSATTNTGRTMWINRHLFFFTHGNDASKTVRWWSLLSQKETWKEMDDDGGNNSRKWWVSRQHMKAVSHEFHRGLNVVGKREEEEEVMSVTCGWLLPLSRLLLHLSHPCRPISLPWSS